MVIIEQIREAVRQCQLNCKVSKFPFHPDDYKLYKETKNVNKEFEDLSSEQKQEFLRFLMVENHFYDIKDQELCYLLLASLLQRGIKKTRQLLKMTLNMEPSNEWSCRDMEALLKEDKKQKLLDFLTKQNTCFKPFQKKNANNAKNNDNKSNNGNDSEANNSHQKNTDKSIKANIDKKNVKEKINKNKEDSDEASTDDDDEEEQPVVRFEYHKVVVKVQKLLKLNGENILVDGIYHDTTEKVILSFQKKKGQFSDGLISKRLIKLLKGKLIKKIIPKLGGVDLKADIKTVKNIRGVQFTKSGQVKFLVDKGKEGVIENGVNSEELALCLSVYFDSSIKSKNISFSLDPWEETNPRGPFQRKVLYPDDRENRVVLAGSKFGELMFECDYLLKQMSMGFMPDGVTPFDFPEELIQKGLKPEHQISDEQENKNKGGGSRWNRLWLVCRKISGVVGKHSNGVFLSDDIEIGVDARQMEQDEVGKLVDKKTQDTSDSCYIFAQKFSELYPVVCKYYPCFEQLKRLYRASAMAKWIFTNGVQVDIKKVNKIAAKQFLNPNDYVTKVAAINVNEIALREIETKIPVEARTVAIRSLKKGNFEINEEEIKWAIEQLVDKNGGKNEFYDTQTTTVTHSVFGGVDMNCEIQQKETVKKLKEGEEDRKNNDHGNNKNNQSFWSETSTDIDDLSLRERIIEEEFEFELEADCAVCKKALSQNEMKDPVENKHYCSLHHPHRCFYCGEKVTGTYVIMNGRSDLYDADSFKGKVALHKECSQIFEGKIYDKATIKNQNEVIDSNKENYLKQVQKHLPEIKSLEELVLKKPANFTCELCKKINYYSTGVCCSLCGRADNKQINNFLREAFPDTIFV